MNLQDLTRIYDLTGRTFVVTGGGGILCSEMARALLGCGANVAVLDLNTERPAQTFTAEKYGERAAVVQANVLDRALLERAAEQVIQKFGKIDGLINGAGGNHPKSTTSPDQSFFDIPQDAFQFVLDLNLQGTVLPSQVFGKIMAEQKHGVILNVSSMNAFRPLTKIPAYSAAKAAVSNFTQWLSVHIAQEYSPEIRVNAIAPGFFLTEQNRFLLTEAETGELTSRGKTIIAHTPMARFGEPADLVGTMLWLLSPAAAFVTGIVVPIDGGFSAYSGV